MRDLNLFLSAPPPKPPYEIAYKVDPHFKEEEADHPEIIKRAEDWKKEHKKQKKEYDDFAEETLL